METNPNLCPKCHGTGRVYDKDGIHTCFDCLMSGKLDNYNRELPGSGEKPKLRLPEKDRANLPKSLDNTKGPKAVKSSDGYIYY